MSLSIGESAPTPTDVIGSCHRFYTGPAVADESPETCFPQQCEADECNGRHGSTESKDATRLRALVRDGVLVEIAMVGECPANKMVFAVTIPFVSILCKRRD